MHCEVARPGTCWLPWPWPDLKGWTTFDNHVTRILQLLQGPASTEEKSCGVLVLIVPGLSERNWR